MKPCLWMLSLLGLAHVLGGSPASAQDNALGLIMSLETQQIWPSQSTALTFVADFNNQLQEPLRWHPQFRATRPPCVICLERTDGGARYLASGQTDRVFVGGSSAEVTDLLLPGDLIKRHRCIR